MTIEEAIAHAEEVAVTAECESCKQEHQQLADWLKELKTIKEQDHTMYAVLYTMRDNNEDSDEFTDNPYEFNTRLIGLYEDYQDAVKAMRNDIKRKVQNILMTKDVNKFDQLMLVQFIDHSGSISIDDMSIMINEVEGTAYVSTNYMYDNLWSIQNELVVEKKETL